MCFLDIIHNTNQMGNMMYAIIGGTGIYQIDGAEIISQSSPETPFGEISAPISLIKMGPNQVLFLPRHGEHHQLLPSEVNYRANIWALKSLGATQLIGISAVGSLREEIKPGDLIIPNQYFDFVKEPRNKSFFGSGLVAHVSTAQPTSFALEALLLTAAQSIDQAIHTNKTYACVDGPRLGTRAESLFLRNNNNDLVGMTNVPEVFLAKEAQISYATLCIATDYDAWMEDPSQHVTVQQVIERYGESLEKAKNVIKTLFEDHLPKQLDCPNRSALQCAVLTPESALDDEQLALLEILKR